MSVCVFVIQKKYFHHHLPGFGISHVYVDISDLSLFMNILATTVLLTCVHLFVFLVFLFKF